MRCIQTQGQALPTCNAYYNGNMPVNNCAYNGCNCGIAPYATANDVVGDCGCAGNNCGIEPYAATDCGCTEAANACDCGYANNTCNCSCAGNNCGIEPYEATNYAANNCGCTNNTCGCMSNACGCTGTASNCGCANNTCGVSTPGNGCGACARACGVHSCMPALAMSYVPDQEFRGLYDSAQGLCRGTIFAELDKPFLAYNRRGY
nr:spore coat associated protein CotJA [Maliibacterium massiliense]